MLSPMADQSEVLTIHAKERAQGKCFMLGRYSGQVGNVKCHKVVHWCEVL